MSCEMHRAQLAREELCSLHMDVWLSSAPTQLICWQCFCVVIQTFTGVDNAMLWQSRCHAKSTQTHFSFMPPQNSRDGLVDSIGKAAFWKRYFVQQGNYEMRQGFPSQLHQPGWGPTGAGAVGQGLLGSLETWPGSSTELITWKPPQLCAARYCF